MWEAAGVLTPAALFSCRTITRAVIPAQAGIQ